MAVIALVGCAALLATNGPDDNGGDPGRDDAQDLADAQAAEEQAEHAVNTMLNELNTAGFTQLIDNVSQLAENNLSRIISEAYEKRDSGEPFDISWALSSADAMQIMGGHNNVVVWNMDFSRATDLWNGDMSLVWGDDVYPFDHMNKRSILVSSDTYRTLYCYDQPMYCSSDCVVTTATGDTVQLSEGWNTDYDFDSADCLWTFPPGVTFAGVFVDPPNTHVDGLYHGVSVVYDRNEPPLLFYYEYGGYVEASTGENQRTLEIRLSWEFGQYSGERDYNLGSIANSYAALMESYRVEMDQWYDLAQAYYDEDPENRSH